MTVQSRKHRGYATQRIVCDGLQDLFPGCYPPGAGESGDDVRNALGWSIEIKARRSFNPLEWMRQARKNSGDNMHAVVVRPDGGGPASLDEWPVIMTFAQFKKLAEIHGTYVGIMGQQTLCKDG